MRILLFLSVIVIAAACKSSTLSISGKQEKAFIAEFLDAMIDSNQDTKRQLHHYINPDFLGKEGIGDDDFLVDAYSLHGYNIESYSDGIITALIWGENKNWMHRLHFKLAKSNNQLYLQPSLYDSGYVTPWWTVDRDVNQ